MAQFPADADGDALRRVAGGGSDMAKPMAIEFAIAVPDRRSGEAVAEAAASRGFDVEVSHDEPLDAWTCYCCMEMVATYERLLQVQEDLQRLAEPHGGDIDGWETAATSPDAARRLRRPWRDRQCSLRSKYDGDRLRRPAPYFGTSRAHGTSTVRLGGVCWWPCPMGAGSERRTSCRRR